MFTRAFMSRIPRSIRVSREHPRSCSFQPTAPVLTFPLFSQDRWNWGASPSRRSPLSYFYFAHLIQFYSVATVFTIVWMTLSLAHGKQIAQFRQRCKEVCASGNSSPPQYPARTSWNTGRHERGIAYANILANILSSTHIYCIFRNIIII